MRFAKIELDRSRTEWNKMNTLAIVQRYMPSNYKVIESPDKENLYIYGHDDHGWTMEDYVIPRLASGLIWASEISSEDEKNKVRKVINGKDTDHYHDANATT